MSTNPIQKIGQIGIPVKNLDRAIPFYQEQLGLPLLFNNDTMAFFDCNGVRLLLSIPENEQFYQSRIKQVENRKEVVATATSMLAEKIKSTTVILKRKMHDDDKLYGSVAPNEIVDLLADKGISISKNQVQFEKSIKSKGTYEVTIKLSSRLQPQLTVKVVPE